MRMYKGQVYVDNLSRQEDICDELEVGNDLYSQHNIGWTFRLRDARRM